MSSRRRAPVAGGRVRTHHRDTDDCELLGAALDIDADHAEAVLDTEGRQMTDASRRNYRNRIKHITTFLKEKYKGYYAVGVRTLMEEDKQDKALFHHTNDEDLVYKGLNVKFIKAFLANRKTKENGKISSMVNLRKYKDAIMWGSKRAN